MHNAFDFEQFSDEKLMKTYNWLLDVQAECWNIKCITEVREKVCAILCRRRRGQK